MAKSCIINGNTQHNCSKSSPVISILLINMFLYCNIVLFNVLARSLHVQVVDQVSRQVRRMMTVATPINQLVSNDETKVGPHPSSSSSYLPPIPCHNH